MHHHCEIWLDSVPMNGNEVDRSAVESIINNLLAPFNEQNKENNGNETFYDWYELGGCYTGQHDKYIPHYDPVNQETCNFCKGKGIRPDIRPEDRTWTRGCNTCDGTGIKTKWHFVPHKEDIMPLEKVREDLSCYTLIIAHNLGKPEIFHRENWNGKTFDKNDEFNGHNVVAFLKSRGITKGWLVTVDYHN